MVTADLAAGAALVVMAAAVVLDRLPRAGPVATAGAVATELPAPPLAEPVLEAGEGSFGLPRLGAMAEGWALMGPSGTLVATNLPERAALLAGACAVLRLAGDADDQRELLPWHTVTLEGPHGYLLGEMSPRGAVLAVLARGDTDRAGLRRGMADALAEVERRWDDLLPAGGDRPAAPLPAAEPEAGVPTPFTPLD